MAGSLHLGLLLCGGGTGGHLFPGIAVAEELRRQQPGSRLLFAVTGRELELDLLRRSGIEAAVVPSAPVKGRSAADRLRGLRTVWQGIRVARRLLRRFRPDVVLGVGGYAAVPVMFAARLCRVPCCLHEQNALPGLANRLLARVAVRVFLSLPDEGGRFPPAKVVLTGNPVRRAIVAAGERSPAPLAGERSPHLLVLGGSQGARRVNELVVSGLEAVANRLPAGLEVTHQTGARDEERVRAAYRRLGIKAEVRAFFDDMAALYGRADLVVARAGATTLAELAVTGRPALLIPYPHAADDHQARNAEVMVARGAARMMREEGLAAVSLGRELASLIHDRPLLCRMGDAARTLGRPAAAAAIVGQLNDVVASRRGGAR